MCTGMEIAAMIAGPAMSALGAGITANEERKNAERMAAARNERLNNALMKNDELARKSRATFDQRVQKVAPEEMDAEQQKAEDNRGDELENAVNATPNPAANVALSGSAPTVVQSEIAKRTAAAMGESRDQARRLGSLGGYGDMWLGQGLADTTANRDIAQDANFASGNWAIMPYQQDIAETRAYKPISPLGGILQGLGGAVSSYGGGMTPKKGLVKKDPWFGMR